MSYWDTQDVSRNYLVLTMPFKRVLVQTALKTNELYDENTKSVLDDNGELVFYNVAGNATESVTTYGKVRLLAEIYNNEKIRMSEGQFLPATAPTIILEN